MDKYSIDGVLRRLCPGQSLSIELLTPAGVSTKGVTQMVGMLPGEFILIKMPTLKRNDPFSLFHSGSRIVLRWLIIEEQARVVALECPLNLTVSLPCKMLVLGMPVRMEQRELRSHLRVNTRYQVSLNWQGAELPAVMTDLSLGGCALELNVEGFQPEVADALSLAVSHPASELLLQAEVCSCRRKDSQVTLGVRFNGGQEKGLKGLLDYLLINVYGLTEGEAEIPLI
jgi:hypothetical protein